MQKRPTNGKEYSLDLLCVSYYNTKIYVRLIFAAVSLNTENENARVRKNIGTILTTSVLAMYAPLEIQHELELIIPHFEDGFDGMALQKFIPRITLRVFHGLTHVPRQVRPNLMRDFQAFRWYLPLQNELAVLLFKFRRPREACNCPISLNFRFAF